MDRFMGLVTGAATLGVVGVADRVGLFAKLAGQGPLTLEEVVERTRLERRYLEEILSALAAGGILTYDPDGRTFELPEAHAACLADEGSPYLLAGWSQIVPALLHAIPGVATATREGGGVPFAEFGPDMVQGIARSNAPGTRVLLVRKWLRALPEVVARLEAGIRVADVGCGVGAAATTLARAFPGSTVVGFDVDLRSIEHARKMAREEGVTNVTFERIAAESIPTHEPFDFVMSFDTIHDMVDPRAALRRIREAIHPEGTYLMVEPSAGDTLEENLGPGGALMYAMSTLHCMTVSLAHGGEGLGAAWGARRAEELCREAGFSRFDRLDVQNPFNAFYAVRP
jgi:SAM-dependent methyltransferase